VPSLENHLSHASVDAAYQILDSDFSGLRELYDQDAILTFCWGSTEPNCIKGSVDEILLPFHQALKTFKHKLQVLTGDNGKVTSIRWNNYQETPDGCGQVTTGIAVFKFNDKDKVVRHYSLSDDDIYCVPNYLDLLGAVED
jgi:hypothetical protein